MKPPVRLASGNPYAILAACGAAAEKAGWLLKTWREFVKRAKAGEYDRLLAVVEETFEVTRLPSFSEQPENWRPSPTPESVTAVPDSEIPF